MPITFPSYTSLTFQNQTSPPLDAANMQSINNMLSPVSGATIPLISKTTTVTLLAAGWSTSGAIMQTVSVPGVTSTNSVLVSSAPSSFEDYTESMVRCTGQGTSTLTFTASYQPQSNIVVNVTIMDTTAM